MLVSICDLYKIFLLRKKLELLKRFLCSNQINEGKKSKQETIIFIVIAMGNTGKDNWRAGKPENYCGS